MKEIVGLNDNKILDSNYIAHEDSDGNIKTLHDEIKNLTTYSTTEEIKTGETWIDGKPIYRKSFNITLPTTGAKKYELDISSLGIKTGMFDMNNSYYYDTTYQRYYPICVATVASSGAGTAASNLQSIVYYNSNYTKIIAEGGHTSNWKLVITLRYTKTTD